MLELTRRMTLSRNCFMRAAGAYIDEDGFIHITGRKKNVIITKNGKNIYPEEIETLLLRNDYIKECMVYGKKDKDDVKLAAELVLDNDYIEEKYCYDDFYILKVF